MMTHLPLTPLLPPMDQAEAIDLGLPESCVPWPLAPIGNPPLGQFTTESTLPGVVGSLARANALGPWDWPEKPVIFISDLHADAESLLRSLTAARTIQLSRALHQMALHLHFNFNLMQY